MLSLLRVVRQEDTIMRVIVLTDNYRFSLLQQVITAVAMLTVLAIVLVIMRTSDRIVAKLGETVPN